MPITHILGKAGGAGIGGIVDAVLEVFARIRSEPYLVIDEFDYLGRLQPRGFSKDCLLLPPRIPGYTLS